MISGFSHPPNTEARASNQFLTPTGVVLTLRLISKFGVWTSLYNLFFPILFCIFIFAVCILYYKVAKNSRQNGWLELNLKGYVQLNGSFCFRVTLVYPQKMSAKVKRWIFNVIFHRNIIPKFFTPLLKIYQTDHQFV